MKDERFLSKCLFYKNLEKFFYTYFFCFPSLYAFVIQMFTFYVALFVHKLINIFSLSLALIFYSIYNFIFFLLFVQIFYSNRTCCYSLFFLFTGHCLNFIYQVLLYKITSIYFVLFIILFLCT